MAGECMAGECMTGDCMPGEWIDDQGIRAARNFLIFTLHFSFAIPKLQIGIPLPFSCLATSFRLGPSYFYRRVRLLRSSLGAARSLCATIEPRRKPMIATCPTSDRLQDYVLGKLPEQESDELYGHLAGCDCCQQKLEASDSQNDSFVGQFKIDGESESFHQEPAFWQATDRAKDIAVLLSRRVMGDVEISGLEGLANSHGPETFPRFIGEYQVDRVLGRGGMGTVYLGHHTKLDRAVALKVISRHRLADPKTQGRFASEMKAVGRMNHPNIVAAHDAREVDGTAVLVTEYIDGLNVGSIIRRVGPLTIADATRIACDVAAALGAINDAGLIHRDVKPSNIMVSRAGQVKLLDLGLARLQDTNGELQEHTATGQALGTVDYIAPEQINEGRDVDVRADIYALGCTLFRMLTGQPVFDDVRYATAFAKMTAHVQVKPSSLGDIAGNIPAPLVGLVAEMLQKDPAQRPQTPQALVERLAPFTTGANLSELVELASKHEEKPRAAARSVSTSAAHRTSPQRGSFWSGRFFFLVGSGFGGLFLGLAMAWLMGIEITIKHADGTTTTLKVASGSIVTIDEHGNATVELSPPLANSNASNPSDPSTDSVVVSSQVPMLGDNTSRGMLAEQRKKLLEVLTDPAKSKLDPLAGVWLTGDGEGQNYFVILGREQYSLFLIPQGEVTRGAWRTDNAVYPRTFDMEKDGGQGFDLGVSRRFRPTGSHEDLLTVYMQGSHDPNQRPQLGENYAVRLDLKRCDLSMIESIANSEETDAIFRILSELLAEPKLDSEESTSKQQPDHPISETLGPSSSAMSGQSGPPSGTSGRSGPPSGKSERSGPQAGMSGPPAPSSVDREIKVNEARQLNGVWRFENESRFQGAFLLVMNETFVIVGGPQEKPSPSEDRGQDQAPGLVEFVGNVAFDPTTDPPQFDFVFLGSRFPNLSGVSNPMLGICQIVGHTEIRRTEKQADDSATSTTFAFPYENVELKIWFAQPGKPRPTSKTTGNGVDQLQLVRIDMSETINEQELNNEIPAEVRTIWKAMSEQSAKK